MTSPLSNLRRACWLIGLIAAFFLTTPSRPAPLLIQVQTGTNILWYSTPRPYFELPTTLEMQAAGDSGYTNTLQWKMDLTSTQWLDIASVWYTGQCPVVWIGQSLCTNFQQGFIRIKITIPQ